MELSCLGLLALPAAWAEDESGERLPVDMEAMPGALLFFPPEAARATALHLAFGPAACRIRGARWYVRPTHG